MHDPLHMPCGQTGETTAAALPCVLYKALLTREGRLRFTYFACLGEEFRAFDGSRFGSDPLLFFGCLVPEDREAFMSGLGEASHTMRIYRDHHRAVAGHGAVRWLFTEACPSRLSNGETLFSGVTLDITESLKRRDNLLRVQRLESVERLASGIAHDFNNLLQGIMGNITLAKARIGDPERAEEHLCKGEQACLAARDLTHRLLAFAEHRHSPGRAASVGRGVEAALAEVAVATEGVTACIDIPSDLPPVGMDEEPFRYVISSILTNAYDAMPRGGVLRVHAERKVAGCGEGSALGEGDYVEIIIEDEGAGISEGHVDRVFDPYFTTKRMGSVRGRGLSLSICHSVVVRHHGFITVDSKEGRTGTVIRVLLPAAPEMAK